MGMDSLWRKWVLSVVGAIILIQSLIVGINVFFDPLWCFEHPLSWNILCEGFDERQQKTDKIVFLPFSYDTLLLGSSRVTYMQPPTGEEARTFNYSVSSMKPREYTPYLNFATSRLGHPFRRVFLGLDFFGTNALLRSRDTFSSPETYFARAQSPFFRWRMATGIDALRHSLDAAALSFGWKNPDGDYRQKDGVRLFLSSDAGTRHRAIRNQIADYRHVLYGTYRYESARTIYQTMLREHATTQFLVFTTPESVPLLRVLVEEGRLEDYERWLRELVEVFGTVWNFMYANSISANLENYKDAHHFSPEVGRFILQRVLEIPGDCPEDFGILIDKNNLEEHLQWVRKNLQNLVSVVPSFTTESLRPFAPPPPLFVPRPTLHHLAILLDAPLPENLAGVVPRSLY